jgi:uncharacterized membrane protein YkoI
MNTISYLYLVLLTIFIPAVVNADPIKLICTGEKYVEILNQKSTYNFDVSVDIEKKEIRLRPEGKKELSKEESQFDRELCPSPIWNTEISESTFKVVSACKQNDNYILVWEIRRTDGTYIYNGQVETAKGQCVKTSDRAF